MVCLEHPQGTKTMTIPTAKIQRSQSDVCMLIDRLVQAIACTSQPAFIIAKTVSGVEEIKCTKLSWYFDSIYQMVNLFVGQQDYTYAESLQVFWQACQEIGLEYIPFGFTCLNEGENQYLSYHDAMNKLVSHIRQLLDVGPYKRRKDDRIYESNQKRESITAYCNEVLDQYSRTVVVRVNLYYHKFARARLRVEHVFEDLERLAKERGRNPIFNFEIGYICGVEQGKDMGFHIHAAFFFNGAKVRSDYAKAREIGALWTEITEGRGFWHSSNDEKLSYGSDLGVGTIRRDDALLRAGCIKAMHYLVKDTQPLLIRPRRGRVLRKGVKPSRSASQSIHCSEAHVASLV